MLMAAPQLAWAVESPQDAVTASKDATKKSGKTTSTSKTSEKMSEKTSGAKSTKESKSSARSRRGSPGRSAGKKVIELEEDEFEVFGKLEKPSAFYVLQRSSTDHDWSRIDAKFTPLVLESVQDPLF